MDQNTRQQLRRVHGRPLDPVSGEETEHFYVCAACGQAVDSSLYQCFTTKKTATSS